MRIWHLMSCNRAKNQTHCKIVSFSTIYDRNTVKQLPVWSWKHRKRLTASLPVHWFLHPGVQVGSWINSHCASATMLRKLLTFKWSCCLPIVQHITTLYSYHLPLTIWYWYVIIQIWTIMNTVSPIPKNVYLFCSIIMNVCMQCLQKTTKIKAPSVTIPKSDLV